MALMSMEDILTAVTLWNRKSQKEDKEMGDHPVKTGKKDAFMSPSPTSWTASRPTARPTGQCQPRFTRPRRHRRPSHAHFLRRPGESEYMRLRVVRL